MERETPQTDRKGKSYVVEASRTSGQLLVLILHGLTELLC